MKACKSGIDFRLYLVTDRVLSRGRPLEQIVRESAAGGVTVVQLREKDAGAREFLDQAFALRQAASDLAIPLIINDRVDIALACRADGVHLGQGDMHCALARRIAGKDMIIGVSVSTADEALEAEADGADYLIRDSKELELDQVSTRTPVAGSPVVRLDRCPGATVRASRAFAGTGTFLAAAPGELKGIVLEGNTLGNARKATERERRALFWKLPLPVPTIR